MRDDAQGAPRRSGRSRAASWQWPASGACLLLLGLVACRPTDLGEGRLLRMEPDGRSSSAAVPVRIIGEQLLPRLVITPAGHTAVDAPFTAWLEGPSGQVPLEDVRFYSSTRLEAVVPAGLRANPEAAPVFLRAGSYTLHVRTPQGAELKLEAAFTVRLPPILLGLGPLPYAPPAGGGRLELYGRNFVGETRAWLGEQPLAEPELLSPELLIGRIPPGNPGTYDVKVATPYGEDRRERAFTYLTPQPLPVVEAVTPDHGSRHGGTPVEVQGTGFDASTAISFAGQPLLAPRFDPANPTIIRGTTPPGEPGPTEVIATNRQGSGPPLPGGFRYLAALLVERIEPDQGPERGGTRVTLLGSGFEASTEVFFGSAALREATREGADRITGLTPPGRGLTSVRVLTQEGEATLLSGFRYQPPPSLQTLEPTTGPGLQPSLVPRPTEVQIRGSGFAAEGLRLWLGGRPLAELRVVDDHLIEAQFPPASGPQDLVLATDLGVAARPAAFTFHDLPRVHEVWPARGHPGAQIEVRGVGFTETSRVQLGDPAAGIAWIDVPELRLMPGGLAGRVPELEGLLTLRVTDERGSTTVPQAFLALPATEPPRVDSFWPQAGSVAGGQPLVIRGIRLPATTEIWLGGHPLSLPQRIGEDAMLGRTPPGQGCVAVTAAAAGWATSFVAPYCYLDEAPLAVNEAIPAVITTDPGALITLVGHGFTPGCRASLGGSELLDLQWVSPERLEGRDPGGFPGPVPLLLECPTGSAYQTDLLRRVADHAAEPLAIIPAAGPAGGGFQVTILGPGLEEAAQIWLGEAEVEELTPVGPGRITGWAPAGPVGPVELVVQGSSGWPVNLPGAFRYLPESTPQLLSVSPEVGPASGGTALTIRGAAFTPETVIEIGGTPIADLVYDGPRTVRGATPPGPPGPVFVQARWPDGTVASLPGGFRYRAPQQPAVIGLDVTSGPTRGGTLIEITGRGLREPLHAMLGGRPLLDRELLDATRLRARTPPGSGQAKLRIECDGEGVELAAAFTYEPDPTPRPQVTALLPALIPAGEAVSVQLLGQFPAPATEVWLGGQPLSQLTRLDAFSLLGVTSPLTAPGELELVLHDDEGEAQRIPAAMMAVEPAEILAVQPDHGPEAGGTLITIRAKGRPAGLRVELGGVPAVEPTIVQPVDPEGEFELEVHTPPGIGSVALTLANCAGQVIQPAAFEYEAAPRALAVNPIDGPAGGRQPISVVGRGFGADTTLLLGGQPLIQPEWLDATTIRGLTPGGWGGVDAEARDGSGNTNLLPGAFRYLPSASLADWWPRAGRVGGGALLQVRGEGLPADLEAWLGDHPLRAEAVSSAAGQRKAFRTAAGSPNERVALRLAGSTGSLEQAEAFLYLAPAERIDPLDGLQVRGLAARSGGGCWLATDHGLRLVESRSGLGDPVAEPRMLPSEDILTVAAPVPSLLLVGTRAGLAICAGPGQPLVCRGITQLDLPALAEDALHLTATGMTGAGEALAAGPAGIVRLPLAGEGVMTWLTPEQLAPEAPPGQIRQLQPDEAGDLWLATDTGLLHYAAAGRRFTSCTRASTNGWLPSDDVRALAVEPGQPGLYVGTAIGLVRFQLRDREQPCRGAWEPVTELQHLEITSLSSVPDHSHRWAAPGVWALANQELVQLRGTQLVRRLGAADGLPAAIIRVAADDAGLVWVLAADGLWRITPE